jgi:hypothetical protein
LKPLGQLHSIGRCFHGITELRVLGKPALPVLARTHGDSSCRVPNALCPEREAWLQNLLVPLNLASTLGIQTPESFGLILVGRVNQNQSSDFSGCV